MLILKFNSSADEIVCYNGLEVQILENIEITGLTKIKSYPNTQVNNFVTFKSDLYTVKYWNCYEK